MRKENFYDITTVGWGRRGWRRQGLRTVKQIKPKKKNDRLILVSWRTFMPISSLENNFFLMFRCFEKFSIFAKKGGKNIGLYLLFKLEEGQLLPASTCLSFNDRNLVIHILCQLCNNAMHRCLLSIIIMEIQTFRNLSLGNCIHINILN